MKYIRKKLVVNIIYQKEKNVLRPGVNYPPCDQGHKLKILVFPAFCRATLLHRAFNIYMSKGSSNTINL